MSEPSHASDDATHATATAPATRIPASWRIASGALLAGGVAVGVISSRLKMGRVPTLLLGGLFLSYAIPIFHASRRPSVPPNAPPIDPRAPLPTMSVVVAGRDEANVIGQLVRDVAAQDHRDADGSPLFELVIVDDRSTDGTGAVALAAAREAGIGDVTRVIRREGEHLPDGKGAALTAAQPQQCRNDVVVVLDADARIAPHYLRRTSAYFGAGVRALTPRRRTLGAGTSLLAQLQGDEQTLDGELQRGRWSLGGCSEFRGNGITLRRDLLEEVGGWRAEALTEDLDLSSRVAAAEGIGVAWALDVEVWEEPVHTWRHYWRQRVRWGEGGVRRAFEHSMPVLLSPRLSLQAKSDYLTYVGQLAVAPLGLGLVAGSILGRRFERVAVIATAYLGITAALGWDGLRWESKPDGSPLGTGERLRRSILVALATPLWAGIVSKVFFELALGDGAIKYDKMHHEGDLKPHVAIDELREHE